jgi:chondroitin 4-sulfotransferase 11
MTINHEKKLIFIHIPKNAGTSIIKAMGVENLYMDKTIKEYKEHYGDYWNEYKKFTVVREPIDRFISAYKFARMDESGWFSATGEEGLEKHHHYELCNEMNINEYISHLYKNPEKFNRWIFHKLLSSQMKMEKEK